MDVKYIMSDWLRAKQATGELIGGFFEKGMFGELKDLTNNLEYVESLIRKYDSDGVISFHHVSQETKYQKLCNDYEELHRFTKQAGEIVDDVIDQRFYEDIDAFVESMRSLRIEEYTTKNRIDATTIINTHHAPGGSVELTKDEITLNDLFTGDSFYANQIKLEYEQVKEMNPDQEFSLEDYQQVALNTHAFEYESIKDQQFKKEFWANIAALIVVVGATLIFPPAGIALGAVYGTLELKSAVSGKDWVSGRELETGERWFRGALAPLDIIPGVAGAKKFVALGRVNRLHSLADIGLQTKKFGASIKNTVGNTVSTAKAEGLKRLKQAKQVVGNKLKKDWDDVKHLASSVKEKVDEAAENIGNIFRSNEPAFAGGGEVGKIDDAASTVKNADGGHVNFQGSGSSSSKNGASSVADDFIRDGSHLDEFGNLKPNRKYQAGEYEYIYETDELGRIKEFTAEDLQLTTREDRLPHNPNTLGKEAGDHAGHLAGDRFGGSPELDNLVSQSSDVNLSKYKKLENQWAKAIEEGKDVSVNVKINYNGNDLRPSGFDIEYKIDGEMYLESITN